MIVKNNIEGIHIDNTIEPIDDTLEPTLDPETINDFEFIDKSERYVNPKEFESFEELDIDSLDECKIECKNNKKCHWLQQGENKCYLFSFTENDEFQIQLWGSSTINGYTFNNKISEKTDKKQYGYSEDDCFNECFNSDLCLFTIYNKEEISCQLVNMKKNKKYTISYFSDLPQMIGKDVDPIPVPEDYSKNNMTIDTVTLYLYGLTIGILILVAVILYIFKKRSDNEKQILYTLSANANSQSRSRSKSSPSDNLSYLNSGTYFQNASSVTVNPDYPDGQKPYKGSNMKKNKRKSTGSKAPSIHSISTLCTNTSNPNNQADTLSLTTKKSSYNYSIKTFSAKDPSLTNLSQNIKTIFANSYNGTNEVSNNNPNNYYDPFNTLSTSSSKMDIHDNGYIKDSANKNIYTHHKKRNSSISINIPKNSNGSTISVSSPKLSYSSPILPNKVIKIKKPLHAKQFSVNNIYPDSGRINNSYTSDGIIGIDGYLILRFYIINTLKIINLRISSTNR